MENLETKLVDLIDKIEAAGSELAPEVIALGAQSMYWDGVVQIITGTALLFIWVCILSGGLYMTVYTKKNARLSYDEKGFDADTWGGVLGATTVATVLLAIPVIATMTNNNPWLKIFNPEAALVKQLLL